MDGQVNWPVIKLSAVIITCAVFFLVNVYETVFAVRDIASEKINKEQLERAKAEAELEALKTQIDPHFIFNSLNTLSHLIEEHPLRAKQFNDNLAEVYRYILLNKASGLVLLKDELEFLENYFSLIRIRFEDAVMLNMHIDSAVYEKYLLPPISLQILVENAIKHNEFSERSPLVIEIVLTGDALLISNRLRRKTLRKPSSQIGLRNLSERYKLTTGKELIVEERDSSFLVVLPLLKLVDQR
jgi:LytS/YehU family sensor histidine kinase